jgi:hypothetical protein
MRLRGCTPSARHVNVNTASDALQHVLRFILRAFF